jgi:hypothetical protein
MPIIKRPSQQQGLVPQPTYPQLPAMGTQPGHGMGGDDAQVVRWHDFRRHLGALEQRMTDQLSGMREQLLAGAQPGDVFRSQPNAAMGMPGLAGLGEPGLGAVAQAVVQGRVGPWFMTIDVPYTAGVSGERVVGEVLSTTDGPVFVTDLMAFAFIDSKDTKAQNFPFSMIDAPSCNPDCGSNSFTASDQAATFSVDFGSQLIPGINVQGMSIPISVLDCKLICCGQNVLCATLDCPDGSSSNFQAVVPMMMLDHPDCLSGVTEINVNGCNWQNTQFPLDLWSPQVNWDITNEVPDCIGVGAYLDCQKILQVALTLTRAPKFNVDVSFVFAGFRLITCGAGSCGVPIVAGASTAG